MKAIIILIFFITACSTMEDEKRIVDPVVLNVLRPINNEIFQKFPVNIDRNAFDTYESFTSITNTNGTSFFLDTIFINKADSVFIQVQAEVYSGELCGRQVENQRILELFNIYTIENITTDNISPSLPSSGLFKKTILHDFMKFNFTGVEFRDVAAGVEDFSYFYPWQDSLYHFIAVEDGTKYLIDFNIEARTPHLPI